MDIKTNAGLQRELSIMFAKLGAVEAERDRVDGENMALDTENNNLRARVAAVEAVRDMWKRAAEAGQAQIAAVEALCDDPVLDRGGNDAWWVRSVRAAARGEGERAPTAQVDDWYGDNPMGYTR